MSDAVLDPEELEAIQATIRQSAPARSATPAVDATPLALIASDRDAMSARPRLLAVATPWARQLERALRAYLTGDVRVDVVGAEIVHGRSLRDELRATWRAAVRPQGGGRPLLVAIGGSVVEAAAARRCGAQVIAVDSGKEPTPTAIKLFRPVGAACVVALGRAFRDRESVELDEASPDEAVEGLYGSDAVIAVTLTIASPCNGRIKLYAVPSAAAAEKARLDAVRAAAPDAHRALAGVSVELRAVLGSVELSLAELRDLQPGATFTLPTFVDSAVPVYIGGVLKALAKPVVSRGVIAVEIESVITDPGATK